jgi:hypothetical protein
LNNTDVIFKDLMVYLSYHSNVGIILTTIIIAAIYLAFSIKLLLTTRDVKMNLYALCFVPGVNIIVWVIKCIKNKNRKKLIRDLHTEGITL